MDKVETIVFFRRDLRIPDNYAIQKAIEQTSSGNLILPIFCFDPRQVGKVNQYRSSSAILFMVQSLIDLDSILQKQYKSRLFYFYGEPHKVLESLCSILPNLHSVVLNYDMTPFSKNRDLKLQEICESYKVQFIGTWGEFMFPPRTILTGTGKYYEKFTPFYNKAKTYPLPDVLPNFKKIPFVSTKLEIPNEFKQNLMEVVPKNGFPDGFKILHEGGRTSLLQRWNDVKKLKNYQETRDIPSLHTTEWSAALKFGCISVREAICKLDEEVGLENGIVRQLYFRYFYFQVMNENPRLLEKNEAFLVKWNQMPYQKPNEEWLNAWKEGKTGFPIIDAGIRQMLKTGFMHNRVRMLVASFLNKDLGIDWRIGEQYFAEKLYDYDPSQNNAGWQSTNGMGASALDWMRVMNPWTQTRKFDADAIYIKEWVPELRNFSVDEILNWDINHTNGKDYPIPIVSHSERAKIYLDFVRKHL